MSQVLSLIIAASVFMLTALTLIVVFEAGIFDATEDTSQSACASAVETNCNLGVDRLPTACTENGEIIDPSWHSALTSGQDELSC